MARSKKPNTLNILLIYLSVPIAQADDIELILVKALERKLISKLTKRPQTLEKISRDGAESIETIRFDLFGKGNYGEGKELERFLLKHGIVIAITKQKNIDRKGIAPPDDPIYEESWSVSTPRK